MNANGSSGSMTANRMPTTATITAMHATMRTNRQNDEADRELDGRAEQEEWQEQTA